MKKRLLLFLSVLLLLPALICGCHEKKTPDETPKEVVLSDADGVHACIAYPNGADDTVLTLVERLRSGFAKITGAEIPAYCEAELPDESGTVIWFGNTWAAWQAGIAADSGYYRYTVQTLDGDVYLYSLNEQILTDAVVKFNAKAERLSEGGNLILPADFSFEGTLPKYALLSHIPYFEGADYLSTHDCGNGHEMMLFTHADRESFLDYCNKIASDGFQPTFENDMNGNLFRTFFNGDGIMIHTYLTAYSGEVRVIIADNPARQTVSSASAAAVCEPLLYPLPADGGMGYVFRLADGSFLVVDGGYQNTTCRNQLYEALLENAPDPNHIVISCWIITHGHEDHVGTFMEFATAFHDDPKIEIRSFLQNMCLTDEQCAYLSTDLWEQTLKYMSTYYPSASVYTALTGQIYTFAGADVEIFYTMTDYLPKCLKPEPDTADGNIQSTVFRVTLNRRTVFMMADTTSECCNEMCARYGSYLHSDYVQMAHHGIADERPKAHNATKEIYALISPSYALLPCSTGQVSGKLANEVNQYLLTLIGGKDQVICSGSYRKSILFPAS